jgi:hypothetical protein
MTLGGSRTTYRLPLVSDPPQKCGLKSLTVVFKDEGMLRFQIGGAAGV